MPDSGSHEQNDRASGQRMDATEFLIRRGIAPTAREFRLRQEFTRYGWDVRVRPDGGTWSVAAEKAGRARVVEHGTSEADALRLALAAALRADDAYGAE